MRRITKLLTVAALLALAACGSSKQSSPAPVHDARLIPGFDPPAPAAGEIQIVSPIYKAIQPGADVLYCSYIDNPFTEEVDITASLGELSASGHHGILYEVGNAGTVGDTHVCTDDDMSRARLLGGAVDAAKNFPIPEGIAIRVNQKAHILIQTHWINATPKPFDGQAIFNVTVKKPDGTRQPAQSFTVFTSNFDVKAREAASVTTECVVKEDLNLFFLAGHMHEWGSHVLVEHVSNDAKASLIDTDWTPEYQTNPPRKSYTREAPLTFKKGDTVRVTCNWKNTTDHNLVFPQEMCVAFGMFFPATVDIDCVDGQWSKN